MDRFSKHEFVICAKARMNVGGVVWPVKDALQGTLSKAKGLYSGFIFQWGFFGMTQGEVRKCKTSSIGLNSLNLKRKVTKKDHRFF